jgi:hypothetical protein
MQGKVDIENKEKILLGLEKAYRRLVRSKRKNNGTLVVIRKNKIVKIKP